MREIWEIFTGFVIGVALGLVLLLLIYVAFVVFFTSINYMNGAM